MHLTPASVKQGAVSTGNGSSLVFGSGSLGRQVLGWTSLGSVFLRDDDLRAPTIKIVRGTGGIERA